MGTALSYAAQIFSVLPSFIQAGKDVSSLLSKGKAVADSGQDPTAEQWQDLNATIKTLRGELHAPD